MSTALKDLAVELNIFVMSSTQLNAKGDDNSSIRNEGSIAGSRSIINKADVGVIVSRPQREELALLQNDESVGFLPNMVTDVYKVRSGEWTQVRIWSDVNLGNLRKKDLFVTNERLEVLEIGTKFNYQFSWDEETTIKYQTQLKEIEAIS